MIAGIDIGTSYSSICVLDGSGKIKPVDIATGTSMFGSKYSLPSAVFVEDNGNILVGQAAMNSRKRRPQNFRMEFKRDLGQDIPIVLGNASFLPEDFYTELFRHMKASAGKMSSESIETACLTCPAAFGKKKREKVLRAAREAGFFNVQLVDEPSAAAMSFKEDGVLSGSKKLLIYDFGGGTFDVSLLAYDNGRFSLMTEPSGLERCGGIDIDRMIFEDMQKCIAPETLAAISKDSKRAMRMNVQLSELAVKAKHHLSTASVYEEYIEVGMDDFEYTLTLDKLNTMIAGMAGQTIDVCRKVVEDAGIKMKDLSAVLMVGGTSRVPLVRNMVKQMAAGVPVYCSADVDLAVARGALMFAKSGGRMEKGGTTEKATTTEKNSTAKKVGKKDAGIKADAGGKAGYSMGDSQERKAVPSGGTASHGEQAVVLGDVPPQISGYSCLFIAYGSYWEIYPLEGSSEQVMYKLKAAAAKMPSNLKFLTQQGDSLIVGIKADKTVAAWLTGNPLLLGIPQGTEKEISQWEDITHLELGFHFAAGIKSDQRVIVTENSGLQTEVSQWRQIYAVSCGFYHIVGLRNDHTVIAAGHNSNGQCNVGEWKDIVAIACGSSHTVGLKADGTVVGTGKNNDGQLYLNSWRNITQVACGTRWTIGLKSDGTVVAAGDNAQGQCQVSDWKEIQYIFCISGRTVGIKKDGSVLCTNFRKLSGGKIQVLPEKVFRLSEKILAGKKEVSDKWKASGNEARETKKTENVSRQQLEQWFDLGCKYHFGRGVSVDDKEAVKWFRKAAEGGHADAQNNLGVFYERGEGITQDYSEAVKWYRKAAESGDAYAQYNLGLCYDQGKGVEKNVAEAEKWLKKAAAQGDVDAQKQLDSLKMIR